MSNIVIGKMGRSIYFDRSKWKDGAGNNEAPLFFSAIARLNPHNTYYLIGKSDFGRVSQEIRDSWFPHGNVVDCWENWNVKEHDPTTWIVNVLKDIHIDYGIIHGGMVSLSIPNKIYCLDRKTKKLTDKLRSPLASLVNYVSPITYYLNDSGIDWITFTSDGRYMPMQARDLINVEKASLGVREGVAEVERMISYEQQDVMKKHQVKLIYAMGEAQYLLDEKQQKFSLDDNERTIKLGLFFHQYDDKKRIKTIKEIVDAFSEDEVVVYGKWKDVEDNKKYKGTVPFDDLQTILPSIKYTFCYPITPGDISAKWVEAVSKGIIPFFYGTYDKDKLLNKYLGIPLFFWFNSPEELREKIEYLESKPILYSKARAIFTDVINDVELFTGAHFNDLINVTIKNIKNGLQ